MKKKRGFATWLQKNNWMKFQTGKFTAVWISYLVTALVNNVIFGIARKPFQSKMSAKRFQRPSTMWRFVRFIFPNTIKLPAHFVTSIKVKVNVSCLIHLNMFVKNVFSIRTAVKQTFWMNGQYTYCSPSLLRLSLFLILYFSFQLRYSFFLIVRCLCACLPWFSSHHAYRVVLSLRNLFSAPDERL